MKNDKLHNIKTTGFKAPEAYFEMFEEQFFERLESNKPIAGIDATGYTVPKDYFDSIEEKIVNKLNSENKPVIKLSSRKSYYYVAGIAASLLLMFSLVFNNNKIAIDGIDTAAIENYLYQEDYSNDELLGNLFQPNDISETDFIDINVSDETLSEYFENIDTEDLILD